MRYVLIVLEVLMVVAAIVLLGITLGWDKLGEALPSILTIGGGILVAAFALWLLWLFRESVLPAGAFLLGKLLGTNNRRAFLAVLLFLAAFVWEGYQFYRVMDSYLDRPLVTQGSPGDPASARSDIEQSVYRYWDDNRPTATVTPPAARVPRGLESIGWFVRQTVLVIVLGLFAAFYLPISRLDEFRRLVRRIYHRINESSGGVLEAERPGLIRQWFERVFGPKPAPTVAAAPAVAVAAVTAPSPAAVAAPTTPAPAVPGAAPSDQKPGFLKKWGHWFAIGALLLEELFEYGPFVRRRRRA